MIDGTDERLCVDCRAGDNSSVFNVEMLDDMEIWEARFPGKPWLFDTDESPVQAFVTEDEACAAQRAYRQSKGFDPMSGDLDGTSGQDRDSYSDEQDRDSYSVP